MPGNDNFRAPFKYTIPITRASADDGELYIEGEASGPELDTFGTRIDVGLMERFVEQIQTRVANQDPIAYRDTHGMGVTGDNGVLVDLGDLVAAAITPEDHLHVRVHLDKENPAAVFLHRKVAAGKRYGMSIGGNVLSFKDEYSSDAGKIIRRFSDVVLDHIANTTQPSWTPSLGTVLTRAVDKALEGDNVADEIVPAPETPVTGAPEATPAEATPETPAEATSETAEEHAAHAHAHEEEPVATPEPVPAVRMIEATALAPVADAVAALSAAVAALTLPAQPVSLTLSAAPNDAARSVQSESPVTENDDLAVLRTGLESLQTELATANDRIRQLESEPAGSQPEVIERDGGALRDELGKLSPHERLLLGLQAARAAQDTK